MTITRQEFANAIKTILTAFPGVSINATTETMSTWFNVCRSLVSDELNRVVELYLTETTQIYPGTNLGAVILKMAKPKITEASIEDRLYHARELFRSTDGKPYEFLRKISPELCRIADRAGLFQTELSAEDLRWTIKDIAKRWLEAKENHQRGFGILLEVPKSKMIEPPQAISDEQLRLNQARVKNILEGIKINADTAKNNSKT